MDFHKIWYGHYAIKGHSKVVHFRWDWDLVSMKMAVFWHVELCSLVDTDWWFDRSLLSVSSGYPLKHRSILTRLHSATTQKAAASVFYSRSSHSSMSKAYLVGSSIPILFLTEYSMCGWGKCHISHSSITWDTKNARMASRNSDLCDVSWRTSFKVHCTPNSILSNLVTLITWLSNRPSYSTMLIRLHILCFYLIKYTNRKA
jgi:hypothetical protein